MMAMAVAVFSDMGCCLAVVIVSDEVVYLSAKITRGRGDREDALNLQERERFTYLSSARAPFCLVLRLA